MNIRQAKESDSADLTELTEVLGYHIDEKDLLSNLRRLLPAKDHIIFVAEKGGRVIGMIEAETYEAVYSKGQMLNVLGLVVDTGSQGQGIGGQLIEALENEAKARACSAVRLNSSVARKPAHQFYENHGYVSDHDQKRFMKLI